MNFKETSKQSSAEELLIELKNKIGFWDATRSLSCSFCGDVDTNKNTKEY